MKAVSKTILLSALAGAGIWALHRHGKYPIAKGYPPLELLSIPGSLLTTGLARIGNTVLRRLPLPDPPAGIQRSKLRIQTADGFSLPLTLYRPAVSSRTPLPCLFYLHGGAFCLEAAGYLHRTAADYARYARCAVVLVHYRTSDLAPFPVPFQDCCTALRHIWDHSDELFLRRDAIAIGGDSAGGALAAACTLWARDETEIRLCHQMLLYPVTDARMNTASMKRFPDSPLWNSRLNRRMWQLYLRRGDCGQRAYASPMEAADFSRLPPAYIEVEQFDCLRDEGLSYARALKKAGVFVELQSIQGTFHGFDLFRRARKTQCVLRIRSRSLLQAFQTPSAPDFLSHPIE